MSWNDYVTSKLINTVDANQHKLENVLEHGALIGCNDGVTWDASAGFAVGKNKGTVEGSGEEGHGFYKQVQDSRYKEVRRT